MADPLIYTFGPGGRHTVGPHTVYTRRNWSDDWEEKEHLHCLEAVWSVAPAFPTATFRWDFSRIRQIGETDVELVKRLRLGSRYVKVVFETSNDDRLWVGRFEVAEEEIWGERTRQLPGGGEEKYCSGRQTWHATGPENWLDQHEIIQGVHAANDASEVSKSYTPLTFNRDGEPNRGTTLFDGAYVFAPKNAETWSTKQIVEHLLAHQTPLNEADEKSIEFYLADEAPLPDWDDPELSTDRQTTFSLLNRLIDRRRLLLWRLFYMADGANANKFELQVFTMAKEEITIDIDGADPIPAAANQRVWIYEEDQLTSVAIKDSGLLKVDQVIVRGDRQRNVGTFSVQHGNLEIGWQPHDEVEYELAASIIDPDYPSLATRDREKRNAEVRGDPKFANVYTRFVLPPDWDGKITDERDDPPGEVDFLSDRFPEFVPDLTFEPTLPLRLGVDYSDDRIKDGPPDETAADDEMRPLVVLIRPGALWVAADQMGSTANLEDDTETEDELRLACHVYTDGNALVVRPANAPQHILAGAAFNPRPEDKVTGVYDYDNLKMFATLSIRVNQIASFYPYKKDLPGLYDMLRIKVVEAGDEYRRTRVLPGTVVGIKNSGELNYSSGGYIESPPNVFEHLRAIAKLAFGWYGEQHAVCALTTYRHPGPANLEIGDFVTAIGAEGGPSRRTINGPVTEIRLRTPRPEGSSVQEPELSVSTWAGELDPMRVIPPPDAGKV